MPVILFILFVAVALVIGYFTWVANQRRREALLVLATE